MDIDPFSFVCGFIVGGLAAAAATELAIRHLARRLTSR